jgi:hypothetical protein
MYTFTYLDENHKNYLEDKLNFYGINHSNLIHINLVNQESTLIIKTNFNLDNSITNGILPIDLNVIQVLKAKPFINVIFFNETEPDNYDVIKYIRPILNELGLEEKRFTIINNNEELIKYKGDSSINVYVNHPHIFAGAKEMIKVEYEYKQDKKYLFMSYNRNLKAHRFFFLCLLKKHGLLDNTDWSWLRGDEMSKFIEIPDWFYQQIMNKEQYVELSNEITLMIKEGRKVSEYEHDIISNLKTDDFDYPNHYKLNPYRNSYIHIVNESYYEDKEAILLSEKSIIPLYFSQLPIYLASYNHLKYFREEYDFDLFDDLINHDYDNEPDNYLRMEKLLKEIKRLNDIKQDVIEFCKQNQNRFNQNKQRVIEIVKTFKDSKNFKNMFHV